MIGEQERLCVNVVIMSNRFCTQSCCNQKDRTASSSSLLLLLSCCHCYCLTMGLASSPPYHQRKSAWVLTDRLEGGLECMLPVIGGAVISPPRCVEASWHCSSSASSLLPSWCSWKEDWNDACRQWNHRFPPCHVEVSRHLLLLPLAALFEEGQGLRWNVPSRVAVVCMLWKSWPRQVARWVGWKHIFHRCETLSKLIADHLNWA